MQTFHVVIDTSVLTQAHFSSPSFRQLLLLSQKGWLKVYIPRIVLEERRTQELEETLADIRQANKAVTSIKRRRNQMLFTGLRDPILELWSAEEVDRHSRDVYAQFIDENKIEVLDLTLANAIATWDRYFKILAPFNSQEPRREERRKDIPDAWILEAAQHVKTKCGDSDRLCALVQDGRLKKALADSGFEIFTAVNSLVPAIEDANRTMPLHPVAPPVSTVPLDQRHAAVFKDLYTAILGMNERMGAPSKEKLFDELERLGFQREMIEHSAQTLVLAKVLSDTGDYLLPVDRDLARQVADDPLVEELVIRSL